MWLFHPTFWHEDHIENQKAIHTLLSPGTKNTGVIIWADHQVVFSDYVNKPKPNWHDLLATFVFLNLGARCRCIESLVWHGSLVRRKNHPSYPSSSLTFFRAWNAFSLGWDQQTMWNLFWTTQVWSKSIKWSYVISKMKIIKYILASTIFELSFKEVARL